VATSIKSCFLGSWSPGGVGLQRAGAIHHHIHAGTIAGVGPEHLAGQAAVGLPEAFGEIGWGAKGQGLVEAGFRFIELARARQGHQALAATFGWGSSTISTGLPVACSSSAMASWAKGRISRWVRLDPGIDQGLGAQGW
jgi:hypothetical protein